MRRLLFALSVIALGLLIGFLIPLAARVGLPLARIAILTGVMVAFATFFEFIHTRRDSAWYSGKTFSGRKLIWLSIVAFALFSLMEALPPLLMSKIGYALYVTSLLALVVWMVVRRLPKNRGRGKS